MKVEYNKIYRVVNTDNYNKTVPETYWCYDLNACKQYINDSYYKHCLDIEESLVCDVPIKCC